MTLLMPIVFRSTVFEVLVTFCLSLRSNVVTVWQFVSVLVKSSKMKMFEMCGSGFLYMFVLADFFSDAVSDCLAHALAKSVAIVADVELRGCRASRI